MKFDLRTKLDIAVIIIGVPLIVLAQTPVGQPCGLAVCPPAAITVVPTPKVQPAPQVQPVPQVIKPVPLPAPTNLAVTKCINGVTHKQVKDKWEPMQDSSGQFILCKQ